MTVVEFKSNSGSVKVNSEDMPKIAEKAKQLVNENDKVEEEIIKKITIEAQLMANTTRLSKIKPDKDNQTLYIEYHGLNKKYSKETKFAGYEPMIEKKYFKFQDLKEEVCEILGFPEDWLDEITVTGISLNYDPECDELRGMVVTMRKDIENLNCPLNINTPFIKFANYCDNYVQFPVEESQWSYETLDLINDILKDTFKYMCGDTRTRQRDMFE